ncbi:MAG: peptidoglycan-binding domain-containing protein [Candidatus Omnitrophota bacterium]|nr:peptidoglycan-binding domain-containing protein [Candidatus Omnitrophota bacterium]
MNTKIFSRELKSTSINIGLLPEGSQSKRPEETIETIKTLITETRDAMGDVQFSMAVVSKEVNTNWIINTRQPANKAVRKLNLHIQRVLAVIGYYNGTFDGSMEKTFNAVVDFQSHNGLKADGILGKRTWKTIRKQVEVLAAQ